MNVLVTGGAGYIGSHAVKRLLEAGHTVVAVDNLFRGHAEAIEAAGSIAPQRLTFIKADVSDRETVAATLERHRIDTVMHFAALAYVGESVDQPLRYYRNNIEGLIALLEAIDRSSVRNIVFSSSCSTYGQPPEDLIPVREDCPQSPMSPYGRTKLQGEHILADFAEMRRRAGRPIGLAFLRYFNVCGCDPSGLLGEDHDPESHIIPVILQAALGLRDHVQLFGTDYATPDGTCVRDYVHVTDLVDAHILAMEKLTPGRDVAYNVGIGKGYSVRQIIESVRRVTGSDFQVIEGPRRAGDVPMVFADPKRIREELGWNARFTDLDDIVSTAWTWFKAHPKGYQS
ncbi:MAG: UDP-glucose 4-epimerase GalE [Phycisphaerales bacterium]|jgi:UDP-glucose 4-epimerase